jgi:hypothetical protein
MFGSSQATTLSIVTLSAQGLTFGFLEKVANDCASRRIDATVGMNRSLHTTFLSGMDYGTYSLLTRP